MHKKGVKSSTKLGAGNKPNPESELEMHINKYLQEIAHSNADLAPHLAELKILSATEHVFPDGSSGIVVAFPVPVLKALQKPQPRIQNRVIGELEKRFPDSQVMFVARREIIKRPTRKFRLKQMRPRSRTLTSVHEGILLDLVYPTEIVGKRIHVGLRRKLIKVYLDKKDKSAMDGRVDCMSNVYKKLTGKDVKFLFHSPVTDD